VKLKNIHLQDSGRQTWNIFSLTPSDFFCKQISGVIIVTVVLQSSFAEDKNLLGCVTVLLGEWFLVF
jgi:hypothetical protein